MSVPVRACSLVVVPAGALALAQVEALVLLPVGVRLWALAWGLGLVRVPG